ncbi:hypothetical protein [Paenibacillus sp. 23TSA30-6]|uniref:hypothetical protein n=1 Tax=Paenibacillus sp. 23TSA30-6 TaxID=2546104 RepID=UPI001787CC26|nr:hypothetical protein [Paenibacillus sp. 23TSA30-6]MBE0335839.1 hypothetical protein [Paenibacillus sp. 23TSA30-6]
MGKIFGYGGGRRSGNDLILRIAVAAGFFSIRFLWGKSGGKGERYRFFRFKSSTPLLHSHKDEFALGGKLGR